MKKLIPKLTGLLLAISLLSASAAYADSEYLTNFSKTKAYSDGQFTDVGDEWYANPVKAVFETGLMSGNSDSTFNPKGNLTNAEAVAVAARLHSIYNTGRDSFSTSSPWYKAYIDYAVSNGICDNNFDAEQTANRAFFAAVLRNAVDEGALPEKNSIADGALYDVDGWYSDAVYSFYRAGVLSGNDQYGTFAPDKPITRAEVAAIVIRIVKPSERVEVKLQEKPAEGTYTLPEDDGSLDAYKRRALVANFKVLLDSKDKDSNWENDVYTIHHDAIASDRIVIPRNEYYWDISDSGITYYIPGHYVGYPINYPLLDSFIKYGLPLNINDKPYYISLSNGNSGDIIMEYAGEAAYDEVYHYSDYTADAQRMIDARYNYPAPNADEIKAFVSKYINGEVVFVSAFDTDKDYESQKFKIRMHYLREWKGNYLFKTSNSKDLSYPDWMTPTYDISGSNTWEQDLGIESKNLKNWCSTHKGKLIISVKRSDVSEPSMLAEVLNYNPSERAGVKTWSFDGNTLNITWNYPKIEYGDVITGSYTSTDIAKILSGNPTPEALRDRTDLALTKHHPQYKTYPASFGIKYSLQFKDSVDDFSETYFDMYVDDNDNITIRYDGKSAKLKIDSDTATSNGSTVKVSPPERVDGDIYLPAEFVVTSLFKDKVETEEVDLSGLTEVVYKRMNETKLYVFNKKEYEDKEFRIYNGNEENQYRIQLGTDPFDSNNITVTINSTKATFWNGKEFSTIKIKAPKMVYDTLYLPADEVIPRLFD